MYRLIFATAVVGFSVVVSAKGVPQTDVYPSIEYWQAGNYSPNVLCDSVGTPSDFPGTAFGSRRHAGVWAFTKSMAGIFKNKVAQKSISDLSYNLKQENLNTSYAGVKQCAALRPALAIQRNKAVSKYPILPDNPTKHYSSIQDGMCGCLATTPPEVFCSAMANYSQETQCLTQYEYVDYEKVLDELDPSKDFGWTFYEQCTRSTSAGVLPLDLPLNNYLLNVGIPDVLEQSQYNGEGKTYYMLYKAIDHLDRYAEYQYLLARYPTSSRAIAAKAAKAAKKPKSVADLNSDGEIFSEILPGWKVLRVFNINEPAFNGGVSKRFPFVVMAANSAGNLLFVVRSPMTTFDERLALYNQQAFKYLYNFTGQVHDGSATLFQALSGAVDFAVDDFYHNKSDVSTLLHPRIIVTGANLPSNGLAVLLADHLMQTFQPVLAPLLLEASVVAFGDMLMSDSAYVSDARMRTNIRNVVLEGDGRVFPCKQTYTCAEDLLPPRTGVNTGDIYTYAMLPGRAQIPLSSMINTNSYWANPDTVFDVAAIRHCGYKCYLTSEFCEDDQDSKCFADTCELMVTENSKDRYPVNTVA